MHKPPTHAAGLLMTGPYADTLTAMSNYFQYAGEGQSIADLWEAERQEGGRRERETEALRETERGNKRNDVKCNGFLLSNHFVSDQNQV